MAEPQENKEPKVKRLAKPGVVVELVKGAQWVDDLSGISLYRGLYDMATKADMKDDKEAKEKGYIKREEEENPTAKIPNLDDEDLVRVEKALKLGILKVYNPKKPTVYEYGKDRDRSQAKFNDDDPKGFEYVDGELDKIVNFLKLKYDDFKEEIKKIKSLSTLEKLYESEYAGRNDTAAARKQYVKLIRKQIKDKSTKGVGGIKSETEETINIEK